MEIIRPALLAILMLNSLTAKAVGDRESTLDRDFQGPRVEWHGSIVERIDDGGDICFVLERTIDPYLSQGQREGSRFIACNPGPFDREHFAPGQVLRVTGNLGEAVPRRIGTQVWEQPLIAGAILKRESVPSYPARHYGSPYYDPFYPSFYGHPYGYSPYGYPYSPGFSTHFFFGRGWH